MKKLITSLAVAAVVASASAATSLQVGVVDYMNVFKSVPQGQAKLESMINDLKPQISALKAEQQKLQNQADDLQKNAPTMSKDQLKEKQTALDNAQQSFEAKVQKLHEEQMKEEQAAQSVFETDLNNAIQEVAKNDHLDLVLNSQAVPYFGKNLDVTTDVIADMKKQN